PSLKKFTTAYRRSRVDHYVSPAQLLDKAQRFLPRPGANCEHADDGADAENDSQRRQNGPGLLRAKIRKRLPYVRWQTHLAMAFVALCGCAAGLFCSLGLASATVSPS